MLFSYLASELPGGKKAPSPIKGRILLKVLAALIQRVR